MASRLANCRSERVATDDRALWRLTAGALVDGYGDGAFTPVDAVHACLRRIERCEPELNALPATSLFELAEAMQRMQHALADVFAQYDFILTPATATLPRAADEPHPRHIDNETTGPRADAVFTPFVNAAGLPAINLP